MLSVDKIDSSLSVSNLLFNGFIIVRTQVIMYLIYITLW